MRSKARLSLLLLIAAGLTIGLHQLGGAMSINWSDPIAWFNSASAEEAIGGTLRTVCLMLGYWITASTMLYVATRNRPRRPRIITALTLPGVRRLVDRTLATALTASIAVAPISPALAEPPPPPPVVFDITSDGIPVPHIRSVHKTTDTVGTTESHQETTPLPPAAEVVPAPVPTILLTPVARTTAVETAATDHTVESGDSLWLIADRHVRAAVGDAATTFTVTMYWRQVIDANHGTLRSGDPNLIFPGEIVLLPNFEVAE
ncbi:MAG: LysM peptidoglycan-binding domain-containing protein [Acidimicrobiia bacterium]|nr:LysM peptidoglycan-binding domain-containing protein [Acidimicrobiia bacterium]MDX2468895.1 LysM peptidoglycan-binding domain-containing protein [Acidimicrobiia bacterium]